MMVLSSVHTRKPPSLWFLFPMIESCNDFYGSNLLNLNSIPPFLLVFFKIGIGNFCLGVLWSSFSLCGLVQISIGTNMDNTEWKEARKSFIDTKKLPR
jgi:hypothetical protein